MIRSKETLYGTTIRYIVANFDSFEAINNDQFSRHLTPVMRFDIYWQMFQNDAEARKSTLPTTSNSEAYSAPSFHLQRGMEDMDTLLELLRVGHRRVQLHAMFESVNDFYLLRGEDSLAQKLSDVFVNRMRTTAAKSLHVLDMAQNLSSFLLDAGWYMPAETVLSSIRIVNEQIMKATDEIDHYHRCHRIHLDATTKLLHAYSEYRHFNLADDIFNSLSEKKLNNDKAGVNLAAVYSEFSNYCFCKSQYREAFEWGMKAVNNLTCDLPSKVIIDVLRQAAKASVVRRQFARADLLIQEALLHAVDVYGENHPKYADCLVDYGFYLLNVDGVAKSVQAYEKALQVRETFYGSNNLLVAKTYEELAYATYVKEYNSGHFEKAKRQAEMSLRIMHRIIPSNHLLMASSQRVLALVLEEIAIDHNDKPSVSNEMLRRAEGLHLSAVQLSTAAFGEMNVQTAKHYGNLGRLYQSMEIYDKAEEMHLKAIKIKESLLGRDDYEVALSIGHLASLYNYDLEKFDKAEELYLRSIEIALRLFGPAYSGLEYDYRGLIRVYEETSDWNNVYTYIYKLRDWKELRRVRDSADTNKEATILSSNQSPRPISKIIQLLASNHEPSSPIKEEANNTQEVASRHLLHIL